jgi:hypothetical protein
MEVWSGQSLPPDRKSLRADVAAELDRAIRAAGSLTEFLRILRHGTWRFYWPTPVPEHIERDLDRRYTAFRFSVGANENVWRVMSHACPRGEVSAERVDELVADRVLDKISSASKYHQSSDQPFHLVIANPYGPRDLREESLGPLRAAAETGPFTEIWLLNMDIDTVDPEPPEPFLVRLYTRD